MPVIVALSLPDFTTHRYTTFDTVGELLGALDGEEDIG
jgi:hypothetical protein